MLEFSHNAALVAAALAIALMAGFTGLSLTRGASSQGLAQRKMTVALAAVVLGGGIWSMHFVAMLGLQLPILFYYDGLVTLVSALIAILMVGLALLILHFRARTRLSMAAAGSAVGLGIVAMHYVGMLGMELCRPVFSGFGIAVALVAAIALSILAVVIAYGARTRGNILLGTVCFGLSVWAVRFIAMAGTGFEPLDVVSAAGPTLSNEVLAMGVTVAAFLISGAFLLTGVTFIGPAETSAVAPQAFGEASLPYGDLSHEPVRKGSGDQAEGVAANEAADPHDPPLPDALTVPFEKEGRTQFLDRGAIAAVRAEGHYTILYSGPDKLFCPWSISEAETRLCTGHFIRAHRSYLINPAYVTEFKRTKDTGACYFDGVEALAKVPVSRSRLPQVRDALGV